MLPKHGFKELASKTTSKNCATATVRRCQNSETIRGLERGLAVLQALHTKPACSLQDLNLLTRIPKPSLLRILRTLEQSGWAARRLADGRYRVGTHFDQVARTRDRYDPLAEAAGPVLERLCRTLSWPSDLMVPAGDHMEIRESSRGHSPFLINRDQIGHPVPWLASAVGRAYLAFCPEKELKQIIAMLRKSTLRDDRPARDPKQLERDTFGSSLERLRHAGSVAYRRRLRRAEFRRRSRRNCGAAHSRSPCVWRDQSAMDQDGISDRRIRERSFACSKGGRARNRGSHVAGTAAAAHH